MLLSTINLSIHKSDHTCNMPLECNNAQEPCKATFAMATEVAKGLPSMQLFVPKIELNILLLNDLIHDTNLLYCGKFLGQL